MGWVVVPALLEGRAQVDARFPNRDKSSEGTIGNQLHAVTTSSHNPDKTGKPEYADGDAFDEVRAWDMDKDLNDPVVTAEMLVQMWLKKLRAGEMRWIRYIIFNHRIWHRRDDFVEREYTGSNPHEDHVHINSDFNDYADTVTNTSWHLDELPTGNSSDLVVDGELGPKTIKRWQQIMGTPADGVISHPSMLVEAVQKRLKATVDGYLKVDGYGIEQDGKPYKTVGALQRYLKSPVDLIMDTPKSEVVKALQRRLNEGRF